VVRPGPSSTKLRSTAIEEEGSLRVNVGDPALVELLLDYFEAESDCIAVQVGECEIEVALLGSYGNERHNDAVEDLVAQFCRQQRQLS
jgi:hypothetical protein